MTRRTVRRIGGAKTKPKEKVGARANQEAQEGRQSDMLSGFLIH